MTLRRWTILVAYVLAALVAPGWHDHGADRPEAPEASAGCEAGGLHLANHPDAPDLSDHADHCPACQLRADHALVAASRPLGMDRPARSDARPSLPTSGVFEPRPNRTRAPPG